MAKTQSQKRDRLFGPHIETLMQRYSMALEHCGADRALIFAGALTLRDRDDQHYPFRADPYFLQWVPLPDAAGSIVEIRPGHKPRLILVQEEGFWHASTAPPPDCVLEHLDVTFATPEKAVHRVADSSRRTVAIGSANGPDDAVDSGASEKFIEYLDFDRAIKTEYEIDCMYRASLMAADGHSAVARALRDGVSEFDLHIRYCEAAGLTDEGLPYPSIIGLNGHASILHYQRHETTPPPHTLSLLIDAGAQDRGYAADVTRTYALGDAGFGSLIEAMDALQREVCANVTAGVDFVALNELCHQKLSELLCEFEFVTCTAATAYEHGVTTAFLPHGLGHLLGLQVHDVGGHRTDRFAAPRKPPKQHPYLRLTRTLEPDMVLTIEPGIYFIRQLFEALEQDKPGILGRATVERFEKFGGIRIEDNLRVKSLGYENLTRSAFGE